MVLDDWDYEVVSQAPAAQQTAADSVGRDRHAPPRYEAKSAPPPSALHAAAQEATKSLASPGYRSASKQPRHTPPTADLHEIAKAAAAKAVSAMKRAAATPQLTQSTQSTQSMTAKEALATAKREGLQLELSSSTASGYKGVCPAGSKQQWTKPWKARVYVGAQKPGADTHIGSFVTKEEAALAYARYVSASEPAAMTAKEALATAKREGLQLALAPGNLSGYKGVYKNGSASTWKLVIEENYLGCFATKEEAALQYARRVGASEAPQVQRKGATSTARAPAARPPAARPKPAAKAPRAPPAPAPAAAPAAAAAAAHDAVETAHLARVCSQVQLEELRGMAGVRALLTALGMPQYAASFDAQGYDDAEYLLVLGRDRAKLEWVGQQTGMSSAHARKMTDLLSASQML